MTDDIKEYVHTCDHCQCTKNNSTSKNTDFHAQYTHTAKNIWPNWKKLCTMVESQEYKYILTICDFFTKWPELVPIKDKKATMIAKELYIIFTRYGCPDIIISDRGTEFCNAVSDTIFTYMRIEHRVSAPYHPQTNSK